MRRAVTNAVEGRRRGEGVIIRLPVTKDGGKHTLLGLCFRRFREGPGGPNDKHAREDFGQRAKVKSHPQLKNAMEKMTIVTGISIITL